MKFLILALILANILIWIEIYAFLNQHEAVDFLDVGQGDGVLITEPKLAILYDAGPNGFKTISEISRVLGPTRKTIDLLLLSHADRDHYGGAFEILERYQVRAIGINPKKSTDSGWQELLRKAQEKNIPIIVFKAGSKIETNRQKFLFLHPPTPKSNSIEFKSDNQYSLVIKAFKQNTNFLLTGDIDAKVEQFLVEKFGNELDVDYLLIPHHGSKYSSSPIFLQITSPKLAIIQVGRNRYGHPHQQTLQKLQQMQIPIWRTDIQGSLVVE